MRPRFFKTILLLTASIGLAFLLGEIGARVFLPKPLVWVRAFQPYFMNGDFYAKRPGGKLVGEMGKTGDLESPEAFGYEKRNGYYIFNYAKPVQAISDRGGPWLFQDRSALADAKDFPGKRIFVLGGSAAFGTGASSRGSRWFVFLEKRLSEELQEKVKVIPAAVNAQVSTQEYLVLLLMVIPRKPDAVIVLDGYNDAASYSLGRPGDPFNQGILYDTVLSALGGVRKWLWQHSAFYYHAREFWVGRVFREARREILSDPLKRENYRISQAAVYADNQERMIKACRQENIPIFSFLQPFRSVVEKNIQPEEQIKTDVHARMLEEAQIRKLDLRDTTPLFQTPELRQSFTDEVHLNDAGQKALGEWVAEQIKEPLSREWNSKSEQGAQTKP